MYTPTLDALAKDGIKLGRFYTQCDCTPSRTALLTGLYPIRTGTYHNSISQDSPWGLPTRFKLIPEYLSNYGYKSYAIGKWDIGHYSWNHIPTARGFDSFLGYYGAKEDYFCHRMPHESNCLDCGSTDLNHSIVAGCVNQSLYDFNRDGTGVEAFHEYSTAYFEREAEAALSTHVAQHPRAPVFLYLAHQAVHMPAQSHGETLRYFSDQFMQEKEGSRAKVAAAAYELDTSVARLVVALKRLDLYNSTVLFFFSDNGATLGQAGGGSNYPLRGSKFTTFEGGVRVPAFVHSPAIEASRRGTTYDGLFHITDMLPTALEIAGARDDDIAGHNLDGVSQRAAVLEGSVAAPRDAVLLHADDLGYYSEQMGLTTGAFIMREASGPGSGDENALWKIVINVTEATWCSPDSDEYRYGARCWTLPQQYAEAVYEGTSPSYAGVFNHSALYELESDPDESDDLKEIFPDKYQRLIHLFNDAVKPKIRSQYTCGCECDPSCDSLYETWVRDGGCFVTPWLTTDDEDDDGKR